MKKDFTSNYQRQNGNQTASIYVAREGSPAHYYVSKVMSTQ